VDTAPDTQSQTLPRWRLADLYAAPDAPELAKDFDAAAASAGDFREKYQGQVAALDGDALAAAIRDFEALTDLMGRIASYAGLLYAANMADENVAAFYQNTMERLNDIESDLLFFTLEINRLDDGDLDARLASESLAHYRPWLRHVRTFRDHQLADDLEKILHDKSVAGRTAWTRLYDETLSDLRFPVSDGELTLAEILDRLAHKDAAVRREAGESLSGTLAENSRLFTHVTNTLIKDKEIEDRWRSFTDPAQSRHLANQVEPEVVEALVEAVTESYDRLSHRYYKLKAQWMGKDPLDYWDRNAPLPEDADRRIGWDEARNIVLSAYGDFSPEMAETAARFFEEEWIDAEPRAGKESGAFSHPCVPSAHPYILLNYQGRARDVMTLAHELGHGVHQVLAAHQGALMADTPLTLAETASVFGEMLTFQSLLKQEDDPVQRRVLLASKVEDMLNTVVRQIAFHRFETRLHAERREGELSLQRIKELWTETQDESLGPAIRLNEGTEYLWGYISHFVHVPFYVYAYAFGECLVNSLYRVYEEAPADFAPKYLDMLKAGGTLRHTELLAPFGLDAAEPAFWTKGLDLIDRFITDLEAGFDHGGLQG